MYKIFIVSFSFIIFLISFNDVSFANQPVKIEENLDLQSTESSPLILKLLKKNKERDMHLLSTTWFEPSNKVCDISGDIVFFTTTDQVGDVYTWRFWNPPIDSKGDPIPGGTFQLYFTDSYIFTEADKQMGVYAVGMGPYIKGYLAAWYSGTWKVELFKNGILFVTAYFDIQKTFLKISGDDQEGAAEDTLNTMVTRVIVCGGTSGVVGQNVTFQIYSQPGNDAYLISGDKTGSSITVVTDANGYANARLVLGSQRGRHIVRAIPATGAPPRTFWAFGWGYTIDKVSPLEDTTVGLVSTPLSEPLVVKVHSGDKIAVGKTVTFTVLQQPNGGGTIISSSPPVTTITGKNIKLETKGAGVAPITVETDTEGKAKVWFISGSKVGYYVVGASILIGGVATYVYFKIFLTKCEIADVVVEPLEITVVSGESFSLRAKAYIDREKHEWRSDKCGDLTYQWYVGNDAISGATGATLFHRFDEVPNSGKYRITVDVTTPKGQTKSGSATIHIFGVKITEWSNYVARNGSPVILSADVSPNSASHNGTFQWSIASGPGEGDFSAPTSSTTSFYGRTSGQATIQVAYTKNGKTVTDKKLITIFHVAITSLVSNNTFISTDQLQFSGEVVGSSEHSSEINWIGEDNPADGTFFSGVLEPPKAIGATYSSIPSPPPDDSGRGEPLSYQITAFVILGGQTSTTSVTITQDNLDELRQEYQDIIAFFNDGNVPIRGTFEQTIPPAHYRCLLDNNPNNICGNDLDVDARHQWWIIQQVINNVTAVDNIYGGAGVQINVTSGYRCPSRNIATVGAARASNHQYGRAFDAAQGTSQENYDIFITARNLGTARADSYIRRSDNITIFWTQQNIPLPSELPTGVTYIQDHIAW